MGKNLIQQRRGRGSPTFRALHHRFLGKIELRPLDEAERGAVPGKVTELRHSPSHSAPLAQLVYATGERVLLPAPEGLVVGSAVAIGAAAEPKPGNVLPLSAIPIGAQIYNIEAVPGDGGRFVRAAGCTAKIIAKSEKAVTVRLPSKALREFAPACRATIGTIAGSGRREKPMLKAGSAYWAARGRYWPVVKGQSMNAVSHPHGGKRSSKKNYPYTVSRHAPPGAKVGSIAASRTGRKK